MNRIKKLSFLLLLATSFSVHSLSLPTAFTPEDDMTSFEDLASAGQHLRIKINEEGNRAHEARVFDLVNTYRNRRNAYTHSLYYYNMALQMTKEKEASLHKASQDLRSSWQWRDYTIATAVVGTFAGGVNTLYEVFQHQYLIALGSAAVTAGAYFAWGFGADWADNARFAAADNLKKKFEIKEQSHFKNFQELTEQKEKKAAHLKEAYAALLAAQPRTQRAQELMNMVNFPQELRS
jgi:hypothetical protein